MSSDDVAVRVENLGKCYQLYTAPRDRLRQFVLPRLQRFIGKSSKNYYREFWALRDVNFEVRKGEAVGIIGRNGSGKSTLLQLVCGTLHPTTGGVQVTGRVAALLELGSGFSPEFTGRENVYANGSLLGMTVREIAERFDSIVSFAELEDFIDQPVKTYSTGMVLRLAFAVQACTDPDILVVDEALAVGDIFFRQKCYKRMENLRSRGCTILLVTHAMDDVEQFCDRAILLELGTSLFQGSTVEAVKRYYLAQGSAHAMHIGHSKAKQTEGAGGGTQIAPASKMEWPTIAVQFDVLRLPQVSNGGARCVAVALTDASGVTTTYFEQGQAAVFWYEFELAQPLGVPMGGVTIHNEKGIIVHGKGTVEYGATVPTFVETGRRIRFKQTIVLSIAPGEYTFEVGMAMMPKELFEQRRRMSVEELYGSVTRVCHVPGLGILGVGLRAHYEQVRLLHHGIADLPGNCEVEVL